MGRTYFKKVGGRSYYNYNSIKFQKAIDAVYMKSLGISKTFKRFSMLKSTICNNKKYLKIEKILKNQVEKLG